MKFFRLASATSAKSNLPQDPIFIDENEKETLDLAPLQICVPHLKNTEEDDASFEGEDMEETRMKNIFKENFDVACQLIC